VATSATLGAFFGLGAGVVVRRSGVRRSLIVGMGAIVIGNLIGAIAPNEFILLAARVIEGAGFFSTVLAIPSILARIVTGHERDFVTAMWSASRTDFTNACSRQCSLAAMVAAPRDTSRAICGSRLCLLDARSRSAVYCRIAVGRYEERDRTRTGPL
jgi:MFS family permease